jgi:carbon monoxide dehydrogenase subunit G
MLVEGAFSVDAPIAAVWKVIRDPHRVSICVPGCQTIQELNDTTYKARVTVALGPIKATFDLVVELTEERPPEFAAIVTRGEEGGRASSITAKSELRLSSLSDERTEVTYRSDVTLVGRLGNYGLGLLRKRAQKLADEFSEKLRMSIAIESPPSRP